MLVLSAPVSATTETFWLAMAGASAPDEVGRQLLVVPARGPPVVVPVPTGTSKEYVSVTTLWLGSVTVSVTLSVLATVIVVFQWNVRSYVLPPLNPVPSLKPPEPL